MRGNVQMFSAPYGEIAPVGRAGTAGVCLHNTRKEQVKPKGKVEEGVVYPACLALP